jgi:hypothetical protein
LLDAEWAHVIEGAVYDAPMEPITCFMADGGADLGKSASQCPTKLSAVADARDQIVSGDLALEFKDAAIE